MATLSQKDIAEINTSPVEGHKGNHPDEYYSLGALALFEQLDPFDVPYSALSPEEIVKRQEQCLDLIKQTVKNLQDTEKEFGPDLLKCSTADNPRFWSDKNGNIPNTLDLATADPGKSSEP